MLTVSIIRMPGGVTQVNVEQGTTLGECLTRSGVSAEGYEIKLGADGWDPDAQARNGDAIMLLKATKGA